MPQNVVAMTSAQKQETAQTIYMMCIHAMTEGEKDRLISNLMKECNWSAEFMATVRTSIVDCAKRLGDKEPRKTSFTEHLKQLAQLGLFQEE